MSLVPYFSFQKVQNQLTKKTKSCPNKTMIGELYFCNSEFFSYTFFATTVHLCFFIPYCITHAKPPLSQVCVAPSWCALEVGKQKLRSLKKLCFKSKLFQLEIWDLERKKNISVQRQKELVSCIQSLANLVEKAEQKKKNLDIPNLFLLFWGGNFFFVSHLQ